MKLDKFVLFFSNFISIILIIGIIFGYLGWINTVSSALLILFSFFLSIVLSKLKFEPYSITHSIQSDFFVKRNLFFFISILFFLSMFILILPNLVFPITCSDLMNHSRSIMLTAELGYFPQANAPFFDGFPLVISHNYPNAYYAIGAVFYSIFGNAVLINSILSIFLVYFAAVFVFLITLYFFDNKNIALISFFISLFAITSIWVIEQGFLPQILGHFFLLSSIYCVLSNKKISFVLSVAGLIVYPPLIGVFLLFILLHFGYLYFYKKTKFSEILGWFHLCLLSFLLVFFEFFGLFLQYSQIDYAKDNLFLIRGGIMTPNFFGLFIFFFALIGLYLMLKNKKAFFTPLYLIISSSIIFSVVIVLAYALNWFIGFSFKTELTALYQAVKYFYFSIYLLSIFAAYGAYNLMNSSKKWIKIFVVLVFCFHLFYFLLYIPDLKSRPSQLSGYYEVTEYSRKLPINSVFSIDYNLINFDVSKRSYFYNSLIDRPNDDLTKQCRLIETSRYLQFYWSDYNYSNELNRFRVYTKDGLEVLFFSNEPNFDFSLTNYYITTNSDFNSPLVFSSKLVYLYKMN